MGFYDGTYTLKQTNEKFGMNVKIFKKVNGEHYGCKIDTYYLSTKTIINSYSGRIYFNSKVNKFDLNAHKLKVAYSSNDHIGIQGTFNANIFSGEGYIHLKECTFNLKKSPIIEDTETIEKLLGEYNGTYMDSNIKYGIKLFVYKSYDSSKTIAFLQTFNINTKSTIGTYILEVSYNSNTKQHILSGKKVNISNSPSNNITLSGTLSGNSFNGYLVADKNSRYNFSTTKYVMPSNLAIPAIQYTCWDDEANMGIPMDPKIVDILTTTYGISCRKAMEILDMGYFF